MGDLDKARSALRSADEADLEASRWGGFARLKPLTREAEIWLFETVADDAQWLGPELVVEMRYFAEIAGAAINAGFTFAQESAQVVPIANTRPCSE